MNQVICESCSYENVQGEYYCRKCGSFLKKGDFEAQTTYSDNEMKLERIISNLKINPHYSILWNDTVNAYTKKVERIQSLLRINEVGIESNELNQKVSDFLSLCRKPDFQIAFVGTIKTGKSTLINSLLGHNYASMDVTPETAALTKFRSSDKDYILLHFILLTNGSCYGSLFKRELTSS